MAPKKRFQESVTMPPRVESNDAEFSIAPRGKYFERSDTSSIHGEKVCEKRGRDGRKIGCQTGRPRDCSPPDPTRHALFPPLSPLLQAARRRAVTELLFFASVGDIKRVERIAAMWNLKVADAACCDYDKRTPLHLAASEGCYKVTKWLLDQGADVNAVDRFRRTPLEEAVRGDFSEVAKLLVDHGGKIKEGGKVWVMGVGGGEGFVVGRRDQRKGCLGHAAHTH